MATRLVVPVVKVEGFVVSVQSGQSVGVVKGVSVAVLGVDNGAVVSVVTTLLVAVYDSVLNVVGVVVVSVTDTGTQLQWSSNTHIFTSKLQYKY